MRGECCGFTLLGLLAIILAIVVLVAILIPFSLSGRHAQWADMVRAVANGSNIYKTYFADRMDALVMDEDTSFWPKSGEFQTSTEFFNHLVTNRIIGVPYNFFAAGKIPPVKSPNPKDFKAENNAWRLVLDLDEQPEGTPFLFTRNYNPDHGMGPDGTIKLSGEPFGSRGLVVVAKGGGAFILKRKQLNVKLFNPPGVKLTVVGP